VQANPPQTDKILFHFFNIPMEGNHEMVNDHSQLRIFNVHSWINVNSISEECTRNIDIHLDEIPDERFSPDMEKLRVLGSVTHVTSVTNVL